MKSGMHLRQKKSRAQIQLSTTALKGMTPPPRIRITAGGNLINYNGNASVCTVDLDTAKLHWNSMVSTASARYMCLDIKIFYLTVAMEYFEYMKIPPALFPAWTIEQYNLNKMVLDKWVSIEMRRAVWGLPQAGILANKCLRRKLALFGYYESVNPWPVVT